MELLTPGVGLIFWQTLTFLIVFAILLIFVWRPVADALRTREGFITDSLKAAENAKKEMERLRADNEYLLEEAKMERDQMLKDATVAANKIKDDAKIETARITSKMIEDAKAVINTEKQAALTDVKNMVAALSLDIAEKVLRKSLENKKAQENLVNDLVKDIKVN